MTRNVFHECSCGYSFQVKEIVEMRIAPGRHWHSTKTKEVVVAQKILSKELKKTTIIAGGREINIFICPKCDAILSATEAK